MGVQVEEALCSSSMDRPPTNAILFGDGRNHEAFLEYCRQQQEQRAGSRFLQGGSTNNDKSERTRAEILRRFREKRKRRVYNRKLYSSMARDHANRKNYKKKGSGKKANGVKFQRAVSSSSVESEFSNDGASSTVSTPTPQTADIGVDASGTREGMGSPNVLPSSNNSAMLTRALSRMSSIESNETTNMTMLHQQMTTSPEEKQTGIARNRIASSMDLDENIITSTAMASTEANAVSAVANAPTFDDWNYLVSILDHEDP